MPQFACNYHARLVCHPGGGLYNPTPVPLTLLLPLGTWLEKDKAKQALFALLSHIPRNSVLVALRYLATTGPRPAILGPKSTIYKPY